MKQALVLALIVAVLPLLRASDDEVILENPEFRTIGIVSVSGDQFMVNAGGAETHFKLNRIKTLLFDTDQNDPDWQGGQQAFWDKKWSTCFDRMSAVVKTIDNGGDFRDMCVPIAYYYYAVAAGHVGKAKISQAYFAKAFASPLFKSPHPLYVEALKDAALLSVDEHNIDGAKALLPQLSTIDPEMCSYVKAEVAMAENDLATASTEFGNLASSKNPVMQARGKMGATRVALAKKSYDDAITSAQAAISSADGNQTILGDAYFYMGEALQAKAATGQTDDDRAQMLQDAAKSFMRVVALYDLSDQQIPAAQAALACFDRLQSFRNKIDSIKDIPFNRYAAKVRMWLASQGVSSSSN
ncbi:MAG: hypothetical protein ACREJ2_18325 [Planctomycetota bacterium]